MYWHNELLALYSTVVTTILLAVYIGEGHFSSESAYSCNPIRHPWAQVAIHSFVCIKCRSKLNLLAFMLAASARHIYIYEVYMLQPVNVAMLTASMLVVMPVTYYNDESWMIVTE